MHYGCGIVDFHILFTARPETYLILLLSPIQYVSGQFALTQFDSSVIKSIYWRGKEQY